MFTQARRLTEGLPDSEGDTRYLCRHLLSGLELTEDPAAHLRHADIFALGASVYELVELFSSSEYTSHVPICAQTQ